MAKNTHPVDIHVGSRIRLRRMMLGMSQKELGEKLNLTFQQVQKYEKGANRVGAGRLHTMSRILDVPVQFFFDHMSSEITEEFGGKAPGFAEEGDIEDLMSFVGSSEGLSLNSDFRKIPDAETRRSIVSLVRTLAKMPWPKKKAGSTSSLPLSQSIEEDVLRHYESKP